jgi:hypothetical protein
MLVSKALCIGKIQITAYLYLDVILTRWIIISLTTSSCDCTCVIFMVTCHSYLYGGSELQASVGEDILCLLTVYDSVQCTECGVESM